MVRRFQSDKLLGPEGIDLTDPGAGRHTLVLDLLTVGSGTQLLDGVGGAVALANAPSVDGIVTASATGTGGGVIRVSGAETVATSNPTVSLTIGTDAEITAPNIVVSSLAGAIASASSVSKGGGAVSIGSAAAKVNIMAISDLDILAGAVLKGETISILSTTQETATIVAESAGGGIVDIAGGNATANIDYVATTTIAGSILAEDGAGSISVGSTSMVDVDAEATGDAAGLGAGATSAAKVNLGEADNASSSDDPDAARTLTTLASTAVIRGKLVNVTARLAKLVVQAEATAEAAALGANVDADAIIKIYNDVNVVQEGGSSIAGNTVNLAATTALVDLVADADSDCDCGVGVADSTAEVTYESMASVITENDSQISAIELNVDASQSIDDYDRRAVADVAALGSESTAENGVFNARRVIDWNADVSLLSGTTGFPELVVDGNGFISRAEGVTVDELVEGDTINLTTATEVSVDPISNNEEAGTATLTAATLGAMDGLSAPPSELRGTMGSFSGASAFSKVSIDNKAPLPLIINEINVVNLGATPRVNLVADSVTTNFDITNAIPANTEIIISNTGLNSDTHFAGVINNPLGSVDIFSTNSILDAGGKILATTLMLESTTGAIGSFTDLLEVDLVKADWGPTALVAEAPLDINLDLQGLLRNTDLTESTFNIDSVDAGGDVNLTLGTVLQQTTPLGTNSASVDVKVNTGPVTGYFVHFDSNPAAVATDRDFRVFPDTSASTPVDGSYVFGEIVGDNITVLASDPAAASAKVHLTAKTNVGSAGDIQVLTNGNIDLTEFVGDFRIDSIVSNAGDVRLVSQGIGANIFDVATPGVDDGSTPWVVGNAITLSARGGIGFLNDFLEINSSVESVGLVTALARDGVYLTETTGDLHIDAIASDYEDVVVQVLSGSLFEGHLDASGDYTVDHTSADSATLLMGALVRLTEDVGGGLSGEVYEYLGPDRASVGALNQENYAGADWHQVLDDRADIQGRKIELLVTNGGIGADDNPIEIYGAGSGQEQIQDYRITTAVPKGGHLYADAQDGIYLTEVNKALDVLKVESAQGDVELRVLDSVRDGEDLNLLAAGGTTLLGTVITAGEIFASVGSVTLLVGDDIHIPVGTLVNAAVMIVMKGDDSTEALNNVPSLAADPDKNRGSTIEILGDLTAPDVYISGGPDLDFIQILGTAGINAAGTTTLRGKTGDDRFFVQAVAGTLNIEGDDGADRYYLSSNASKALFSQSGFYFDGVEDPFALLTGTLNHIADTVSINTGDGGAGGGTRDVILVSAGGESTTISGTVDLGTISGLGLAAGGSITFSAPALQTAFVHLGLGSDGDTLQVKSLADNIVLEIFGRAGGRRCHHRRQRQQFPEWHRRHRRILWRWRCRRHPECIRQRHRWARSSHSA